MALALTMHLHVCHAFVMLVVPLEPTKHHHLICLCIRAVQVQRDGWSVAAGDIVVLPKNVHNMPAQKRAAEMVPFDAVAPALVSIA